MKQCLSLSVSNPLMRNSRRLLNRYVARSNLITNEQVYSRTIVCTRLETAAELAREYQLDGVTLNGSRSDRKGALTGGYHDTSRSRLQAAEKMRKWRTTYEDKAAEARKTKHRVEEIHQEVTRLVGVLKNAKSKRTQIDEGFGPLQRDLQSKYREENALKDLLFQRVHSTSAHTDISNNPWSLCKLT